MASTSHNAIALEIIDELVRAMGLSGRFNSLHEGYAVLLEEVDELWDEVKKNPRKHPDRKKRARVEAIQVAVMAMRIILDCDLVE